MTYTIEAFAREIEIEIETILESDRNAPVKDVTREVVESSLMGEDDEVASKIRKIFTLAV